ncbi:MAG: glycine zipper family protein [Geobacteraceae bacterium]|nr:glycine zipper family protein [Geobacteraceae bacterium]
MQNLQHITSVILLLALSACATLPTGPSVNVMPSKGKSFATFQAEDATCRTWAKQQLGKPTQETADNNVVTGAVAGTAIGAGLGAAVGSASGNAGAGAAIGAASGLLLGTVAGSGSAQVYGREAQHRYDNAYVECMYTYGNLVPEYRRPVATAPRQPIAVTPPPELLPAPGQYPPPPEVYLDTAPEFVFSPALNMYVAAGVPYDLMYDGNAYFYFNGGRWYRGPYYNGPWELATRRGLPPVILRHRVNEIRHYRDLEYRRYNLDRGHYDGRILRPEFHRRERR